MGRGNRLIRRVQQLGESGPKDLAVVSVRLSADVGVGVGVVRVGVDVRVRVGVRDWKSVWWERSHHVALRGCVRAWAGARGRNEDVGMTVSREGGHVGRLIERQVGSWVKL